MSSTMHNLPKAVLFDLDGTLLDSESNIKEAWQGAVAACRSAAFDQRHLLEAIGIKNEWYWGDPIRALAGRLDYQQVAGIVVRSAMVSLRPDVDLADLTDTADALTDDYWRRRAAATSLFPRVLDILATLQHRAIRTALITNGSGLVQREKIARFGLEPWFDAIVISGELGYGKPDERAFRHALDACGVPPEEAWMVGNGIGDDLATPYRLGMHTVWVDATGGGIPAEGPAAPHRVIREIAELVVLD